MSSAICFFSSPGDFLPLKLWQAKQFLPSSSLCILTILGFLLWHSLHADAGDFAISNKASNRHNPYVLNTFMISF